MATPKIKVSRKDKKQMKKEAKNLKQMPLKSPTPVKNNVSGKVKKVTEKKPKITVKKLNKGKTEKSKSFRESFASARKSGEKTFTWKGKSYTTETAGEEARRNPSDTNVRIKGINARYNSNLQSRADAKKYGGEIQGNNRVLAYKGGSSSPNKTSALGKSLNEIAGSYDKERRRRGREERGKDPYYAPKGEKK